ncbi:MAG: mevalonate kinase, partial [Methanomassiliicoccales archaeon]|nr:mevalonate kinase [Methanomassiliicoccales archaeon]
KKCIEVWMVTTSAPGKLILMGEHAVVFGQPAIALAISLRLRCRVLRSGRFSVNGDELSERYHPYITSAVRKVWGPEPVAIDIASELPSSSGLGSSAAVTVSVLAALSKMKDQFSERYVASSGFEVESDVQGRASPIDTSTCTHGHGVFIDESPGENLLWEIKKDTRRWFVHHCEVPEMEVVVGYSGIVAHTGPLVAKVKRLADRSRFGKEIIEEIGSLTLDGLSKLKAGDKVALGELMTKNQRLLAILGVSCPELDRLIKVSLPYSYGAKLTGAGGGGSMIALTDRSKEVCEAIKRRGGTPIVVRTGAKGVTVDPK